MLVVNTYKLLMRGTAFVLDGKQIQQEEHVITEEWYDDMMLTPKRNKKGELVLDDNEDYIMVAELWKKTGFYIEVLEKETKAWKKKFERKQEKMRQMKDIEAAKSSDILSRAISSTLDSKIKESNDLDKDLPK